MKYAFYLLIVLFVLSCNQAVDKQEDVRLVQPTVQPSALELSVRSALTDILTKEIVNSGNKVDSLVFTGMEIVRISQKDYFTEEESAQKKDFENYLTYMEKLKNTGSKMYNSIDIADNKLKHAGVITYLNTMIRKEPEDKNLYKVTYYLKAATKNYKYTRLQTTYLDADLKKMATDYSFLNKAKPFPHSPAVKQQ